jgi:hypothetical protein
MASAPNPTDSAGTSGSDISGNVSHANGPKELSLQAVLEERDRLRKELGEARDELMRLRCRAEILREEWFAAKLQEEEYRKYIHKLTGMDPRFRPEDILDAEKSGATWEQVLAEMENEATSSSDEG